MASTAKSSSHLFTDACLGRLCVCLSSITAFPPNVISAPCFGCFRVYRSLQIDRYGLCNVLHLFHVFETACPSQRALWAAALGGSHYDPISFLFSSQPINSTLMNAAEYIQDTEEYINIELDSSRNRLIRLELVINTATFSIAMYSLVAGEHC